MSIVEVRPKLTKKTIIISLAIALAVIVAIGITVAAFLGAFKSDKPSLSLIGKSRVELEVFTEYEDAGIKATIGKEDIADKVVCKSDVDTKKVGEYRIVYSYEHKDEVYSVSRTVKVVDKTAPKLTLNGKAEITVSLLKFYKEPGFKAVDAHDGDLTKSVKTKQTKINKDTYGITYTVTDNSGNKTEKTRTLIIKDKVKPVISLNGQEYVYLELGDAYKDEGAKASDDVDGNITQKITKSGSVNTNAEGTYYIKYSATDKNGNKATVTRKVIVFDYSPSNKNRVFLTFDDGPSLKVTSKILNILKENDVKATFFICDYADDKKPLIQRMINEGHTIGIHGYSHDYAKIYKSDDAFMKNIYRLRDKLKADFGYEATLIRFPGGSSNSISKNYNKGIMGRLVKRVEKEGFVYFDWNVSSNDATGSTVKTKTIINSTINGLVKKRNNVVLMHDSAAKTTTAAALPEIIVRAKQKGYVFLPLTPEVPPCHHSVTNK